MKTKGGVASLIFLALVVVLTNLVDSEPIAAQEKDKKPSTAASPPRKSPRIRHVISGAENPDAIPDMIAYELFLRTVAEGNARGLVKQIGLDDLQTEGVLADARSLNDDFFVPADRRAFELKAYKKEFSELSEIQARKDSAITRVVKHFLPGFLRDEGMKKLNDFIKSRVKPNIQKVVVDGSGQTIEARAGKTFAKAFAPRKQAGGQLYLYSDGWQDDAMNVFGSASLSEQYTSSTSYRATVTVTSPSGRSNTTQSDWGYATVVHDTGLSIGVEDGNYTITANFDEQTGYYDEYGNFFGTGSTFVGAVAESLLIAPTVTVESVVPPNLSLGSQQSGEFVAQVSVTNNVPVGTAVVVEMYETSAPQFTYTVAPTNRQKSFNVATAGSAVPVDFVVNITQTTSQGAGTNVTNKIKIQSATPPQGSPAVAVGTNAPVATLTYLGPTPSPSPTPGEECRSGFTASGAKYVKGADQKNDANRCSSCNPDPYELFTCQQSGGIYDWTFCFCGQSPIVLDILGNGYDLTDAVNGIFFDITARGRSQRIAWTSAESDDAWLVLDRNQNNRIDDGKEMFGNISEQPANQTPKQGFASLGMFDAVARGGNGDGKITRRDGVFRRLRLWTDRNHNGVSEPEELHRLPDLDVVALRLDYQESDRTDQHGNKFKYRARVRDRNNANVNRWAWDVFLRTQP